LFSKADIVLVRALEFLAETHSSDPTPPKAILNGVGHGLAGGFVAGFSIFDDEFGAGME